MGYLFALLSVFSGSIKGYCGKRVSNFTEKADDAMLFNCMRMFFCIVISFFLLAVQGKVIELNVNAVFLLIAALSGISTAISLVSWLLSVRGSAYMLVEIFVMLGTVVTLFLSYIVYGESISIGQFFGIILLFIAGFIMCSYNRSVKHGKIGIKAWALLILCTLTFGMSDFSQKIFTKTFQNGSIAAFNFYTYIVSAVLLLVFYLISRSAKRPEIGKIKKALGYMLLMSVFLFCNAFFKTKASLYLPAIQLYPLTNSLALTFSTLMAAIFFKEKLTPKCIFGILLSLAAIIIIGLA